MVASPVSVSRRLGPGRVRGAHGSRSAGRTKPLWPRLKLPELAPPLPPPPPRPPAAGAEDEAARLDRHARLDHTLAEVPVDEGALACRRAGGRARGGVGRRASQGPGRTVGLVLESAHAADAARPAQPSKPPQQGPPPPQVKAAGRQRAAPALWLPTIMTEILRRGLRISLASPTMGWRAMDSRPRLPAAAVPSPASRPVSYSARIWRRGGAGRRARRRRHGQGAPRGGRRTGAAAAAPRASGSAAGSPALPRAPRAPAAPARAQQPGGRHLSQHPLRRVRELLRRARHRAAGARRAVRTARAPRGPLRARHSPPRQGPPARGAAAEGSGSRAAAIELRPGAGRPAGGA
jgi:hypothetical protein